MSMEQFLQDWQKYQLTVNTDRGNLTVKWSDADTLAKWSNIQAGLYLQETNSLQTFYEYFPKWYQGWWNQRASQGCYDLPDGAVIVDVGSGIAVQDLLLYSYIPNSKFYLLDKEGFEFYPGVYYDANYPEYNSWGPLNDAITTSGFDVDRFVTMNPTTPWPEQVDCVTSYLSWGWHYPKETYWQQTMDSLKVGGKLVMDIRVIEGRDVMGEITEDMKCEPVVFPFDKKLPRHIDNLAPPEGSKVSGYRAVWTRKA